MVLNIGSTCRGIVDEVGLILDNIRKLKINYYCHIDAAFYGGIPQNQMNSPMPIISTEKFDSISVSLHKFIGNNFAAGVVLATNNNMLDRIDYIGQEDSTVCGSRCINYYSALQKAKEMFERKDERYYERNICFFERLLLEKDIRFEKSKNANIFIIDKPSNKICAKYQLATYTTFDNEEKAHIIIQPFHRKRFMKMLVNDIVRKI